MALVIDLSKEELGLLKAYATAHSISLEQACKKALFEKIEDEQDLEEYESSLKAYKDNPVSYSHSQVCEMLGI